MLVAAQTTTTEVKRIVGDPLPTWVVLAAGLALGVLIIAAGLVTRRHMSKGERATSRG